MSTEPVSKDIDDPATLPVNNQGFSKTSSDSSKSRSSCMSPTLMERLSNSFERRRQRASPSESIDAKSSFERHLHTDPMDSEDSDELEYSAYLESGMMSSSPKTDCLSIDSGSPKSDEGGRWKSYINEVPEVILCSWCKNVCKTDDDGPDTSTLSSLRIDSRQYCSEVCFNLSRRASFKKSKMCDWCQEIKPAVSFANSTDGTPHLQFCGETCLNKYKMSIFMHETKVHMQLHPHINEIRTREPKPLITPDLWLKGCTKPAPKESDLMKTTQKRLSSMKEGKQVPISENCTDNEYVPNHTVYIQSRSVSPLSCDTDEPINLSTSTGRHSKTSNKTRYQAIHNEKPKLEKTDNEFMKSNTKINTESDNSVSMAMKTNEHNSNEQHRAHIRVRRLEDDTSLEDNVADERAPSTYLPSFSPLSDLLLGARHPFMQQASQIVPGAEIPPAPLLQQLLLSNQSMLRFPGMRPPLLFPGPQPLTIPPPLPPPVFQPPSSEPSTFRNPVGKTENFLPVSVMVPLPLPIPIPIPIPIPVPILDVEKEEVKKFLKPAQSKKEVSSKVSVPKEKTIVSRTVQAATSSNSIPHKTAEKKFQQIHTPSIVAKDINPTNEKRIGRRSILRYTSDVYEIEGKLVSGTIDLESKPEVASKPISEAPKEHSSGENTETEVELGSSRRKKRKFPVPSTEASTKRKRLTA